MKSVLKFVFVVMIHLCLYTEVKVHFQKCLCSHLATQSSMSQCFQELLQHGTDMQCSLLLTKNTPKYASLECAKEQLCSLSSA